MTPKNESDLSTGLPIFPTHFPFPKFSCISLSLSNKDDLSPSKFEKHLQKLEKKMLTAAENLDFEKAAVYRDEIRKIKKDQMGVN